LHVLAAARWLRTPLVMVVTSSSAATRLEPRSRGPAAAALVSVFSPVALLCAAGVLVTGAVASVVHLGSFAALTETTYGELLLVKVAGLVCVAAFSALNWTRMRRHLADERGARRVRRSASIELTMGALVLAA